VEIKIPSCGILIRSDHRVCDICHFIYSVVA
jgi:hypothetical protein